jgi:hypothetical protein
MDCKGCEEGVPLVTEAELAELVRPGEVLPTRPGLRLCMSRVAGTVAWHVPEELLAELRARRSPEEPAPGSPPTGTRDKPRKLGEPLEKDVRRLVVHLATSLGFFVSVNEQKGRPEKCPHCSKRFPPHMFSTRVTPGTPDLYLRGLGFSFWVELKREGGIVKPDQAEWHAKARAKGDRVYIIRSPGAFYELYTHISDHEELPPDGEFPPPEEF